MTLPATRRSWRGWRGGAALLLALVACPAGRTAHASGDVLRGIEDRFQAAVRRVLPATVGCVPWGAASATSGFSSGVIVSADGLVLSDGDVGMRWRRGPDGEDVKEWLSDVEVRVPSADGGSNRRLRARVVHRDRDGDTTLLRILDVPAGGLAAVRLAHSDDLRVGRFALVVGTAFDEAGRAPPSVTAGTVAARGPPGGGAGADWIYVSVGVNQGVNGGAVVDLDGRLLGTLSTDVEPTPDEPHQFLARVAPIDRIGRAHAAVPEGARLRSAAAPRSRDAATDLEDVFRSAALEARAAVVSLDVKRRRPVSALIPSESREIRIARYQGPVSGVVLSPDGEIVTSLYNLTNVGTLTEPLWDAPAEAQVEVGLGDVLAVTACFADGVTAPARIVGYDRRLGIVLLRADLEAATPRGDRPYRLPVLPSVPRSSLVEGRFVVAVGNPYGRLPPPEPLVTTGILSRFHPPDAPAPWRGQWQTDAAGIDSNCGGAAVDVDGRLLGLFAIWHPSRHGRHSGIAFVVPWGDVVAACAALQGGRTPERGFLGVRFGPGSTARLREIIPGTAAARAGLRPGDVIHRLDREDIATIEDVATVIGFRCRDDEVVVTVERDGALMTIRLRLGPRVD